MNKTRRNIESIQNQVKNTINDLLVENGYSLVNEEKFGDNLSLLLQWTNKEKNHAFQLIWDIREQWFDLGEFNQISNLNYLESTNIDIYPFSVTGILFRTRYNAKYIAKIKSKIDEKLRDRDIRTKKMDLKNLYDKLISEGCNNFYIEGVGGPSRDDVVCLGLNGGNWEIYYTERGQKSKPSFSTNNKAKAIKYYHDYILEMEHRHMVVFTRSENKFNSIREKLKVME